MGGFAAFTIQGFRNFRLDTRETPEKEGNNDIPCTSVFKKSEEIRGRVLSHGFLGATGFPAHIRHPTLIRAKGGASRTIAIGGTIQVARSTSSLVTV